MALTPLPVNSPLTQLRAQGLDAAFNRCRLIVFPRHKITAARQQFVTDNFESIINELNLEGYYTKNPDPLGYEAKSRHPALSQGYLMWSVNATQRTHLGGKPIDFRDDVPAELNGYFLQNQGA